MNKIHSTPDLVRIIGSQAEPDPRYLRVAVIGGRRFFLSDGQWHTIGATGPETGERYLEMFDEVVVCGREALQPHAQAGSTSPLDPRVKVSLLPNTASLSGQVLQRRALASALEKIIANVDAVILRLGQNSLPALRIARRLGKPVACDVGARLHDSLVAYGSIKGRLYAPLAEYKARKVVREADSVSYVTREYLQNAYPARCDASTFAGSNVEIPTPDPGVLEARKARIAHKPQVIVFGSIGSLSGNTKGIHIALKALARTMKDDPNWNYRVLGGGDPKPLERLAESLGIADRVIFHGTLSHGDPVLRWIDDIDVLLHPSLREGVPRAVIEAMSRGCPVIASSVAGTPELLAPEDLVTPARVDELACHLPGCRDPEWQSDRAVKNWAHARSYSRDVIGKSRRAFWNSFADFVLSRKLQENRHD